MENVKNKLKKSDIVVILTSKVEGKLYNSKGGEVT